MLKTGLDLAVDPFQCKRDLKWIRSSVNASKYGHGSKLDLALEYESRGRGFESYSGHFHSHKLSRLILQILLLLKFPYC